MATAFLLTAQGVGNNKSIEVPRQRFTGLPIRLGRNPLNDLSINHQTISSFHARIEDVGGRLCVVDLGSKNGVHLQMPGGAPPQTVPPNEPTDLAPTNFTFFLGPYIQIRITFDEIRDALDYRGPASFSGSVLGNRDMLLDAPLPGAPPQMGSGGFAAGLPALPGTPPPGRSAPPGGFVPQGPAPSNWPPAADPGGGGGQGRRRSSTAFFQNLGPEMLALQGLRELASSLVPGVTLDTTGEVARFITKVHDSLDVFMRSFIPLRDGYSQFVSSLSLQRGAAPGIQRSAAYNAIEAATTPEVVAKAMLDPRDPSFDAPQAVEGIFADLMLHQLALLEGVMRGVRALLEELSPDNIAQHTSSHLLGRYKALWETYSRRFDDLYEEKQTFSYIFGQEFTAAYRQYRQKRPEDQ